MLPSLDQWKRWSLPSKYTAIGLLLSLISFFIAVLYPISFEVSQAKIVEGEYVVTNLGLHEINYGYMFKYKPKLEFLAGKNGGIHNPDLFEIVSQTNSGFTIKVDGSLTGGTSIVWRASGVPFLTNN